MALAVVIAIVVIALVIGAVGRSRRNKRRGSASARYLNRVRGEVDAHGGKREVTGTNYERLKL
jgi:hypothetical protein